MHPGRLDCKKFDMLNLKVDILRSKKSMIHLVGEWTSMTTTNESFLFVTPTSHLQQVFATHDAKLLIAGHLRLVGGGCFSSYEFSTGI